jgi:NADH:ubiquinone oxidoreductase subunit F (NADH-binding)
VTPAGGRAQTDAVLPPPEGPWRLLAGWARSGRPDRFPDHVGRLGQVPLRAYHGHAGRRRLVHELSGSGLRGRGGAAFPAARKLSAVAGGRGRKVVVANGCEGEPASLKDAVLLELAPHLVIDGALLAAHAISASEIYLCVDRDGPGLRQMETAVRERADGRVRIIAVPGRFVASEESALVSYIDTGDARPTSKPPRPYERGVGRRPTYVGNVETLAQIALVARFGAAWFREQGTHESPGTALVTVGGAVGSPGVLEVPYGRTLGDIVASCGPEGPLRALLVGGCAGSWLDIDVADNARFTHEDLAAVGATVGVASVLALPRDACGLAETAQLLGYLARESAGQCGPCMFGLPAIAADFAALAAGRAVRDQGVLERLQRRLAVVEGRGACAHPDGAVRMARSALEAFRGDVQMHLAGRPCAFAGAPSRLGLRQRADAYRRAV